MSSPKYPHSVLVRVQQLGRALAAKAGIAPRRDRSRTFPASRRLLIAASLLTPLTAAALLPPWLQHVRSASSFEAALYRLMKLPGSDVFFPRPPKESIAELNKLPASTALYSLRAHQEEEALDFTAAESDWKAFANASAANRIQLADFYHRRLAVKAELTTLLSIANDSTAEPLVIPGKQQAWQAFERALALAAQQSLDEVTTLGIYRVGIARYPQQPTVYGRAFTWTLEQRRYADAEAILAAYQRAFPDDQVFPIKASALLALKRGSADAKAKALAVYDSAFQPLWPEALVSSYFALLDSTHNLRHFIADANSRLQQNPDDLNALGRIFLYDQHQSQTGAALAVLDTYRRSKEARNAAWTAAELETLSQLSLRAADPAASARYDFALYSQSGKLPDGRDAKATGLANMIGLLLSTPEQPIALGAGNLSMYRDIATLDQGPGYWNGILSLWFNGQYPGDHFAEEEKKAQPYFQRAKAAELLSMLHREAPTAPQRAALHAQLLQVYAEYGDSAAVVREGTSLLAAFPNADAAFRLSVAMTMADAYARLSDTKSEFALYDRTLQELGSQSQNMPLTLSMLGVSAQPHASGDESEPQSSAAAVVASSSAFELDTGSPSAAPHPEATAYAQVLDRYIGRLTSTQKLPEALAVLRKELDRNPGDPQLYEKLANFLGQNNLSAQQEEVYRRAMAKFPDASWPDKLARFYLRAKRTQDFADLTRKVADTFEGTELDAWFRHNSGGGPQLFLQLNLYAHQRFPHDIVFTENLLTAYTTTSTADSTAWEKLLRETWWQTPDLTRRFFEFLSRSGKLDSELALLKVAPPSPAAQQEAAEGQLWMSHFEQSAPLYSDLAAAYPGDAAIGQTASNLQRSLAWFDSPPEALHITASIAIEERLLAADPGDISRLARMGDILADHADDSAASLAPAAQYWRRMPATRPGNRSAYLEAATVFWDYFQFDDALAQIAAAREHFHEPALFGYEAGAIAEGKRDYTLAVREYVAAAIAETRGESESRSRLLRLVRRASTRDLVDTATANAARNGTQASLSLRISILATLHRTPEVATLLNSALNSAKTADDVGEIATMARSNGLTATYDQALARQAELTTDSVERLQLRYQLARALEDRKDIAGASRMVDDIYKQNPLLLGVVRSTVEFDWRNRRQPQAIAVLVASSKSARAAQPALANQLVAEAAAKANESGDTQQARLLADSLLQLDAYNAQYLSLAADSFVRGNDNAGLQRFYVDRLDALKTASMSVDERKSRTALLRKGLIPALTRGRDYAGALAQYIALLSAYPEDSALNNEAALYALGHDGKAQLLTFLTTTTNASPRDSRFFIDLAQAHTVFGDLQEAVDAYARVIAIRKDRVDIYSSKAQLEETLQRFDDAASDYQRLYILSYKDPQWMVATAKLRARQGRASEAADALRTAWLTGPKKLPRDFFRIAAQLEEWNLLDQAAIFAEQGRTAAGDRFLTPDDAMLATADPVIYARILTRLRRTALLFTMLNGALTAASISTSSPALIAQQAQSQGIASVTDAGWRKQQAAARRQAAQATYDAVLAGIGPTVDAFYTPEERNAYNLQLTHEAAQATPRQLAERWIPAAHAAGLLQREADWRKQLLLAATKSAVTQVEPYTELETSRLRFAELGQTLAAFLKLHPKDDDAALTNAADAFHSAGDAAAELRVLRSGRLTEPALRDRYLNLLVRHDPSALVALAGSTGDDIADAATNLALQRAEPATAVAAVNARGKALPAVWRPATLGLISLYYGDSAGDASLRTALMPDATIGERLTAKPDTARQLTGELWFYYAARDGQLRLLSAALRSSAEETLAADLEYSAAAANYKALAETYTEAGDASAALAELDHVLELDPNDADTHDARALILWKANRRNEAVAAWKAGLASLRVIEDRSAAPESFWSGFRRIALHLHERSLVVQLRPQMDDVLRIYMARNGNYRSDELLQAAFEAAPAPAEGAEWVVSLASAAVDPGEILKGIEDAAWLPSAAREAILLREIQLARNGATAASTGTYDVAADRLRSAQDLLIELYTARHEDARALALFRSVHGTEQGGKSMLQREVVLATHAGELDTLLSRLRSQSDTASTIGELRSAAKELSLEQRWKQVRAIQEFVFERALADHTLDATHYLALAEARLHDGDTPGAVALLHSLTQLTGDTYANMDSAAALLEKSAKANEAIPFLTVLTRSVPWDLSYQVRLAEAQKQPGKPSSEAAFAAVSRNPLAPYGLRVRAARVLGGGAPAGELGSAELNLLASNRIGPVAAQQPFFVAARVFAALQSHDAKQQAILLREAIAISPNNPQAFLDLFHAELRAGTPASTHAVLVALLKAPATTESSFSALGTADSDSEDTTAPEPAVTPLPAITAGWPASARAGLALEFAKVFRRGGDDTQAIAYFTESLRLSSAGPKAEEARAAIVAIEEAQAREAANAARRPVIHKTLDQAIVFRPRLTATAQVPSTQKEEE